MKIDLEQIMDCDHCFHTFGSFGCCTTVSNEWVYSCREGQKKYLLDCVLALIDAEVCCGRLNANDFRAAILALKGEQG